MFENRPITALYNSLERKARTIADHTALIDEVADLLDSFPGIKLVYASFELTITFPGPVHWAFFRQVMGTKLVRTSYSYIIHHSEHRLTAYVLFPDGAPPEVLALDGHAQQGWSRYGKYRGQCIPVDVQYGIGDSCRKQLVGYTEPRDPQPKYEWVCGERELTADEMASVTF